MRRGWWRVWGYAGEGQGILIECVAAVSVVTWVSRSQQHSARACAAPAMSFFIWRIPAPLMLRPLRQRQRQRQVGET